VSADSDDDIGANVNRDSSTVIVVVVVLLLLLLLDIDIFRILGLNIISFTSSLSLSFEEVVGSHDGNDDDIINIKNTLLFVLLNRRRYCT
jgi:hypothetical protein